MRLPDGLPELRGRWLAAYKLLWWAMLAVSLVAVTYGQWQLLQQATRTDMQVYAAGLRPSEDGELTFSALSPAAKANSMRGDSVARDIQISCPSQGARWVIARERSPPALSFISESAAFGSCFSAMIAD